MQRIRYENNILWNLGKVLLLSLLATLAVVIFAKGSVITFVPIFLLIFGYKLFDGGRI